MLAALHVNMCDLSRDNVHYGFSLNGWSRWIPVGYPLKTFTKALEALRKAVENICSKALEALAKAVGFFLEEDRLNLNGVDCF